MIPLLLGKATKDASRSSYTSLVICSAVPCVYLINKNIRLSVFDGTEQQGIVIQHVLHILHLVKHIQVVTVRLYF